MIVINARPTKAERNDSAAQASLPLSPEEKSAVREGLLRPLPEISPRYFYDDIGSELFEVITGLDVYYQTRTEIFILEHCAEQILEHCRPSHIVELGSGAGRKIRVLLDAWGRARAGGTCTMLDINRLFLRQSIERLGADYPDCRFQGIVGNFITDLHRLGPPGKRLIVFFGGTIGNLYPAERLAFLRELAAGMGATDRVLVGVDLVKDAARLQAAYNDPEGVTASFDRNILAVMNRRFDANFDLDAFVHRAFYDPQNAWIEMRLRAVKATRVHLRSLDLQLQFAEDSEIRTEISCKFTRDTLSAAAGQAGLMLDGWFTDPEQLFALAVLRPQQNA